MGFLIGRHGNRRPPYLHTDHLCIESFPGVDALCSGLLQRATCLCAYLRSQSGNGVTNKLQLYLNSARRRCVPARDVAGTVYDLRLQMENRQNSSDEITHIYLLFSIICDTLIGSTQLFPDPRWQVIYLERHTTETIIKKYKKIYIYKYTNTKKNQQRRGSTHSVVFLDYTTFLI